MQWTLASDIDGTLTGERASLDHLAPRLREMRESGNLFLIYSTGRSLRQVITGVDTEGLPEPDAVISQVGTEIFVPPITIDSKPLEAWRQRLLAQYRREEALAFFEGIEGLELQPPEYNTELKTSCYLDKCPDPEKAAGTIIERVEAMGDRYQVVWSSGRDLDILPEASGKGKAIEFLIEHREKSADRVIVAGDSGNDATMFQHFRRGIVVSNAKSELLEMARQMEPDRVYIANKPHAAGVEEGLVHYGMLSKSDTG